MTSIAVESALPPDVRRRLCPAKQRFLTLGYAPLGNLFNVK